MNDFRGYSIKDGDMVIVCYSTRPHMDIGVIVDGQVRTMNTIKSAKVFRQCYLIANPTQDELDLKDEILEKIEENKKKKKERQKELSKYKGTMLGGIYSTTEGSTYIYLGKLKSEIFDENGALVDTKEGNCYYRVGWRENPEDVISEEIFAKEYSYNLQFLKGFKNVTGLAGIHPRFKMDDYRDIVKEFKFEGNVYNRTIHAYEKVKRVRKNSLL